MSMSGAETAYVCRDGRFGARRGGGLHLAGPGGALPAHAGPRAPETRAPAQQDCGGRFCRT